MSVTPVNLPADRRLARMAYRAAHATRMGWFSGLYRLSRRLTTPTPAAPGLAERMPSVKQMRADLEALIEQDLAHIETGLYRMPENVLPGPSALRQAARYIADLRAVDRRRRAKDGQEIFRTWRSQSLPRYYLQNFHYQTDGYLSRRSAELYEFQVEVLFGGSADLMRRQALAPVARHIAGRRHGELRLLDVACGTGGFLAQIKSNWPRLPVTGLDLSPYYLAEAETRLASWSRVSLIEGAAERLPFPDGQFDLVTSVYLLHELPRTIRHRAIREMARVLKPAGLLVLVDSLQRGDRPDYEALMEHFPAAFHEPYYDDYTRDDLAGAIEKAGLTPRPTELAYFSRIMQAEKPG
ncbi:MAG TPA: class I SAM-dependent methyltransferase [Alphaproteobacteria bacterium]|nr:class I SAM-dependent methyltransferase [Alphaproteobacteria bacterium]